jgi:hypothetical protein
MPIASLLAKSSFDPDTVKIMTSAFETAWRSLESSDSTLSMGGNAVAAREFLAKRIIEMGQRGRKKSAATGNRRLGTPCNFKLVSRRLTGRIS